MISTRAVSPARTCAASQRFVRESLDETGRGFGLGFGLGGGGGEPIASETDDELFAAVGSDVEDETLPTFVTDPPAPPVTFTWTVIVTLAAAASDVAVHWTVWPDALHVTPLGPLADTYWSSAGNVSLTTTFVAASGPLLRATSVNETVSPTFAVPGPLFAIKTSADGLDEPGGEGGGEDPPAFDSARVAELLPGLGSVKPEGTATVAVFDSVPVVLDGIVPVSVITTDAPEATSTEVEMFPVPDAGEQPDAHIHANDDSAAGTVSVTVAPTTLAGPALDTVIVYVSGEPGV